MVKPTGKGALPCRPLWLARLRRIRIGCSLGNCCCLRRRNPSVTDDGADIPLSDDRPVVNERELHLLDPRLVPDDLLHEHVEGRDDGLARQVPAAGCCWMDAEDDEAVDGGAEDVDRVDGPGALLRPRDAELAVVRIDDDARRVRHVAAGGADEGERIIPSRLRCGHLGADVEEPHGGSREEDVGVDGVVTGAVEIHSVPRFEESQDHVAGLGVVEEDAGEYDTVVRRCDVLDAFPVQLAGPWLRTQTDDGLDDDHIGADGIDRSLLVELAFEMEAGRNGR